MALEIIRAEQVDETLHRALARLLPQLSPRLDALSVNELQRITDNPSTALFVARVDGTPAGMLTLAWYDTPSGRKARIEDVVTDEACRGRGVGTALVRAALTHAASIGAPEVSLTSRPGREAARALYRKEGFKEVETTVFARKTDNRA